MNQIAQEGAIQMFIEPGSGLERVYVGVVGELQYDVLQSRMESEYGVKYRRYDEPYTLIRKIVKPENPENLHLYEVKWVQDFRGTNYLLFPTNWHINHTLEYNDDLELAEFGS